MRRLRDWFIRFMYGRYGADDLYHGLFYLWIVLTLVGLSTGWQVMSLLTSAVLVVMFCRFLSRNHSARRRENEAFLKLWRPVKSWFILQRDRFRDRRTSRYRKCPSCSAIIKFPNKKGKHTAVCPKCKHRFNVKI